MNLKIINGNMLIAKFMGWKVFPTQSRTSALCYKGKSNIDIPIEMLDYHDDWSLLMPVIKKIKKSLIGVVANKSFLLEGRIRNAMEKIDIKKTWAAVVKFLEWHIIYKNKKTEA